MLNNLNKTSLFSKNYIVIDEKKMFYLIYSNFNKFYSHFHLNILTFEVSSENYLFIYENSYLNLMFNNLNLLSISIYLYLQFYPFPNSS